MAGKSRYGQGASALPALTARQLEAVQHPLAPLMVIAGAGTGKTAMLTRRIAYLIEHRGVPPEKILALTFTDKAADELRNRIRVLTGQAGLTATTFHAFCYQAVLEFNPDFRTRQLMTVGDALFILREHFPALTDLQSVVFRREPGRAIRAFQRFFDRLREELIVPDQFPQLLQGDIQWPDNGEKDDELEAHRQLLDHCAVFPLYQRWKAEAGLVDYGDMIYECWRLVASRPEVLGVLQKRYATIVVDEFQDNNFALNTIVARLAERHHSVTVVGDDDQSIYRFRGAGSYNLLDFRQRYWDQPDYAEIILAENFRSTQSILDLANAVISHNTRRHDKRLTASRPTPRARVVAAPVLAVGSTRAQADYVAAEIHRLLSTGERRPDEIAVLVRTNSQAAEIVARLAQHDVASQVNSVDFFRLPAIRTALAWCQVVARTPDAPAGLYRLLQNEDASMSWRLEDVEAYLFGDEEPPTRAAEVPFAGWDQATPLVAHIRALMKDNATENAGTMVERILVASRLYRQHFSAGFREDSLAIANLNLLLESARDFSQRHRGNSLAQFVRYVTVMHEANALQARLPEALSADAVSVLTVHAAKGLEFRTVFIPFLQSGRFPLNYRPPKEVDAPPAAWRRWETRGEPDGKLAHIEEERRIFYVAITRAREQLTVLTTPDRQAPFVRNLPDGVVMMKQLPEDEAQPDGGATGSAYRTELRQRLALELGRGAFKQAHVLVDALQLVAEHEAGQAPDLSVHPLSDELQRRLSAAPAPEPEPSTLTLSASSVETYETCPLQYRFAEVDKIPTRDRPYLRFGTIIHEVLEAYHRPDRTEPRPGMAELLREKWRSEGFTYDQEETQYREDAAALLATYEQRLQGAEPPVLAVEHKFELDLDNVRITGRIDRIDRDEAGNITVVDYKTSQKRKSEREARQAPQLPMYALYLAQSDEIAGQRLGPGRQELLYYFLRSDDPEVRVTFSAAELAEFRERVTQVAHRVRSRDFPYRTGYHCNYCDYKDLLCPAWETPDGTPRQDAGE